MPPLSIIISTKNDEDTILYFVKKIDETMEVHGITYEIICIDDNSIDLTQEQLGKLSQLYPVHMHPKKGYPGKVQAIFEGAEYAQHENIATIDIKEYSPDMLPTMLKSLEQGAEIVVAQRIIPKKKSFPDAILPFIFGEKLHNLDLDFTSGLKIFKKELLGKLSHEHIISESFDLEFFVRARNAGHRIVSIPLQFEKRYADRAKTKIKNVWNIASCAVNLKFANTDIIPFQDDQVKKTGKGFHFKGKEFIHYSHLQISESAFFRLSTSQKKILLFIFCFLLVGLMGNWHATLVAIFAGLTIVYFADLFFNLYLIIQSLVKPSEIHIDGQIAIQERNWPTYTIFCPLYKESEILPQFVQAMEQLDYPKHKLQVMLLLEEDDKDTLHTITSLHLPSYFEIYVPPNSFPKTKPKALNFGLQYAKGNYCVVYDAEDIPDSDQLKKVILAFEMVSEKIKCIQAKLNFYNPFQNILTRVFTAEYSLWFDLVLTGLQSIHSVIPLGGTSNHFRTKDLQAMQGWDSFNVTEDCDLGLRLFKHGYYTAIVNSTTFEEANSNILNWFSQRGRWIKGYMQTYLVHARKPNEFIKHTKIKQFITFQLVIGGKVMSLFINPLMWLIVIFYFALRPLLGHFIETFFPSPILYMGVLCLVAGNFLYLYYYMIGCAKREQYSLIKYAFLVPFYWLAMSISGWHALYKIITQPYYWAKTHHGLHLPKQHNASILKKLKNSMNIFLPKPHISFDL